MKVDKAVSTDNDNTINSIRYESILNTLVEKKILSIKRDCEQAEQKLKQRHSCLGELLFGKRRRQQQQQQRETTDNNIIKSDCDRITDAIVINECAVVSDGIIDSIGNETAVAIVTNDETKNAVIFVNRIDYDHHQRHGRRPVDDTNNKFNEIGGLSEDCGGSNSTNASHSVVVQNDDVGKLTPILHTDALRPARKISSDTIISCPSSSKHTTFSAPAPITASTIDQEQRRRLRVLEAKSISAQCSPIFPRQIFETTAATLPPPPPPPAPPSKLKSSIPQRLIWRQNTSDDSVNVTFSSVLVNEGAVDSGDAVSDTIVTAKKLHSRKRDSKKLARCSVANDSHGFISSFNQLTSSNNLPVKLRSGGAAAVGNESNRVSRFQSAIDATINAPPTESIIMSKSTVPMRSSDEDEQIKSDKRKNRKCFRDLRCVDGLMF